MSAIHKIQCPRCFRLVWTWEHIRVCRGAPMSAAWTLREEPMSGDVVLYREWFCRACGWVTPKRKYDRKPDCPNCAARSAGLTIDLMEALKASLAKRVSR